MGFGMEILFVLILGLLVLGPKRLHTLLAHAARAELCRRSGKMSEAKDSYERALSLARQEPEQRFLTRRLSEI